MNALQERKCSLDQFRGYSVAAMFVVNFLGGLAVTHQVLKHNNTHFSYADSIMPSFLFACGVSYRLSFLKRSQKDTSSSPKSAIIRRSLGLILLSLMLTAFNSRFGSWNEMNPARVGKFVAELLKANMWEVLAIIGAVQILLLPWIALRTRYRLLAILAAGLLHIGLSWWFNYDFVYGHPNGLDSFLGTSGKRAWDGGIFGLLSWSEIMLSGTIAYDLFLKISNAKCSALFMGIGTVAMIVGYGLSCMTRLYDVDSDEKRDASVVARNESPVVPDFSRAKGRSWRELLAEPPFIAPPGPQERQWNYWMMDKRIVTQSFVLFSTGFAFATFGWFILIGEVWGIEFGLFRTFGQNPLAAYIIHHLVAVSFLAIVPKDSPLPWVLFGLVGSFGVTYLFVRFLEARQLYLRL